MPRAWSWCSKAFRPPLPPARRVGLVCFETVQGCLGAFLRFGLIMPALCRMRRIVEVEGGRVAFTVQVPGDGDRPGVQLGGP